MWQFSAGELKLPHFEQWIAEARFSMLEQGSLERDTESICAGTSPGLAKTEG